MSNQDDYNYIPPPNVVDSRPPEHDMRPPSKTMNPAIVGAILVIIGLIALAANVWHTDILGLLVLPALGIVFLVGAFVGRISGLVIPGSILTGLGLGTLAQQTLFASASGDTRGGIVVLGLALGFLAIMPLMQLMERRVYWWPAIPGGILLLVGIGLLAGPAGASFLQALGTLWPLALIAVGAYLLFRVYRRPRRDRHGLPT
ncbi:MAG: hypothetical protein ACXWQ5_05835 [Ktedonobacterales bacterium]